MRLDLAHGIGHGGAITDVAGQGQHLVAQVCQALGQGRLVQVDSHHLGAFGNETTHHGLAHPLPRAGDKGDFVQQLHSVLPQCRA
ncbi:hypothetical protein D3C79_710780 [compost metagenome]